MQETVPAKRLTFVLTTVAMVLVLFFIGHVALVAAYRSGTGTTATAAAVAGLTAAVLFVTRPRHRLAALLAGIALWALIGETAEKLGYFCMVRPWWLIALAVGGGSFLFFAVTRRLSFFPVVSLTLFFAEWASHFVMVNFFETLGKRHWGTIDSSLLFVGVLGYSFRRIFRASGATSLAAYSVVLTCACWSLLEYCWAWNIIPKPW